MGVDYKAKAVIGIILDEEKIPTKKFKNKTFDHNYPESMRFSPVDGRKLWDEREIPEFTFDEESRDTRLIPLPKNIKLFHGTNGEPIILGFGISDTDSNGGNDYCFKKLPEEDIRTKIKAVLEPLNLWNEETFGLYSILYCSY